MRSCDYTNDRLRARLAGREWRFIEDDRAPGAWNMAVDDALLESARRDQTPPTLRLYGWCRPTVSLGRHQDPLVGINHDFRRRRGIDLVRRPSGGRAVLHDAEVTYSIVLPMALGRGAGVGEVYRVLADALHIGLSVLLPGSQATAVQGLAGPDHRSARTPECLNPASCFATAAGGDGLVDTGKLVGSAQARRAGAVLQHGSVLLAVRRDAWAGLFGWPGLEVGLSELGDPCPRETAVRTALGRGLERRLEARLTSGKLTDDEWSRAVRLVTERYGVGCLD